jgi:hypothetical protein
MPKCNVCGKPAGWWGSFKHVSHAECETLPLLRQIDRGEFRCFDDDAQILLDYDEHCLATVKGCRLADLPPDHKDVAAVSDRSEAGANGRADKGSGALFITDRRIAYMGRFEARTIPLAGVVEVQHSTDTLILVAGADRTFFFVITPPRRLEVTAAVIRKLAALAQAHQKPTVFGEPQTMVLASDY